jgi:hypothetical protein
VESRASLATAHLLLRLRPLNRVLRAAVKRQNAASAMLAQRSLAALCVTDDEVQTLLDEVERETPAVSVTTSLSSQEQRLEDDLRKQSCDQGAELPLDRLAARLALAPFEQDALMLCAAPEFDRSYERIYAYILDDLNRRLSCIELICALTASSHEERASHRHALGARGRLRCAGLLVPFGDPPTELRQELRLANGVFDYLTGGAEDLAPIDLTGAEVYVPAKGASPPQIGAPLFSRLCDGLRSGSLMAFGIWGPRHNGVEELVLSLAAAASKPLRRLLLPDLDRPAEWALSVERQLTMADALGAMIWFDTDTVADAPRERANQVLSGAFASSPVPILLTGEFAWRPLSLLRSNTYAEIELAETPLPDRKAMWSTNFPELPVDEIESLAARYRLASADIAAIACRARTKARLTNSGTPEPIENHLAAACAMITSRSSTRFAMPIIPQRRPEDLILPPALHRQILEVAKFFQLQSHVDEDWGFGNRGGGGAMRVLMTGEPGTGKTLSAEVIAGLLRLSLHKVDLARITSKWVGETEKNLDATFREAEESHSVLFFDEAEALFGRRAEVQSGTDRYANLEVSYLLQRLDAARGLVILASNVRDQIDAAFIRRFQVVLHFPKPEEPERLLLWQQAFPSSAPCEANLDLGVLARLEMTGSAIMSAARTAALLAADAGSENAATAGSRQITIAHVISGISRQFHREGRVLSPNDLGPYRAFLRGA